jgi:hypothetical protein
LDVPLTVDVNTCVLPACTVGVNGEMATEIAGTVIVDEADLVVSVAELAVMVTVKLLTGAVVGAVYVVAVPDAVETGETEPQGAVVQVTAHVTLGVAEGSFVTVGVIIVELPAFTVALVGAAATVMAGTVMVAVPVFVVSATEVAVRVTVKLLATGPGAV